MVAADRYQVVAVIVTIQFLDGQYVQAVQRLDYVNHSPLGYRRSDSLPRLEHDRGGTSIAVSVHRVLAFGSLVMELSWGETN